MLLKSLEAQRSRSQLSPACPSQPAFDPRSWLCPTGIFILSLNSFTLTFLQAASSVETFLYIYIIHMYQNVDLWFSQWLCRVKPTCPFPWCASCLWQEEIHPWRLVTWRPCLTLQQVSGYFPQFTHVEMGSERVGSSPKVTAGLNEYKTMNVWLLMSTLIPFLEKNWRRNGTWSGRHKEIITCSVKAETVWTKVQWWISPSKVFLSWNPSIGPS